MGQADHIDGSYEFVRAGKGADQVRNSTQGGRNLQTIVSSNINLSVYIHVRRSKITVHDYEPLKIIGRGAFGEVRVCRHKKTNEVVAIKKMKKSDMVNKNQEKHVRAERDILAIASNNPWIVDLKCSFQDERFLYLVMEFL